MVDRCSSADPAGVCFVVTPFLPVDRPSLGVGSLIAELSRHGIQASARYLNVGYAHRIGAELYRYVTDGLPGAFLLGELIFTPALWEDRAPAWEELEQGLGPWLERIRRYTPDGEASPATRWERYREALRGLYLQSHAVVTRWADEILAGAPRVVGLSSTFQQQVASLAVARQLRRRVPADRLAIVIGGANCEDDMGRALAESFQAVDHVVSGEAEGVIVGLVRSLLAGEAPAAGTPDLPRYVAAGPVEDLDRLPVPDFDGYFEALETFPLTGRRHLTVEASRGCWWGQRSQCRFCGLNGSSAMAYRVKAPERFLAELNELAGRYGVDSFAPTDNVLAPGAAADLLSSLVTNQRQLRLFFEIRPGLRLEQLELMAAAGVRSIQPGIESLSSPVLKLLGKGTARLENVQLLRWCSELGITPAWSMLYGVPGEDPAEYLQMEQLIPSLVHLPAPMLSSRVRLDRFSPYWRSPARFGLTEVRPFWSYRLVYRGLEPAQQARLAYFFEYEHADGRDPVAYAIGTLRAVIQWREAAGRGAALELARDGTRTVVRDTRHGDKPVLTPVDRDELELLAVLGTIVRRDRVAVDLAARRDGPGPDAALCERLLDRFEARGWILGERRRVVRLVVDPSARDRVDELKVRLRLATAGVRWPEDFPGQEQREEVRAAMLRLW
jgi:ribosomal peptide maturation radical SAM protein 1